jgi:hypothetical protein
MEENVNNIFHVPSRHYTRTILFSLGQRAIMLFYYAWMAGSGHGLSSYRRSSGPALLQCPSCCARCPFFLPYFIRWALPLLLRSAVFPPALNAAVWRCGVELFSRTARRFLRREEAVRSYSVDFVWWFSDRVVWVRRVFVAWTISRALPAACTTATHCHHTARPAHLQHHRTHARLPLPACAAARTTPRTTHALLPCIFACARAPLPPHRVYG